jgi:hypothetical protein
MKKLLVVSLLLAFACAMAFAEDGEGDEDFMHVQLGASVLYKQPFNDVFSFYNFRGGVTGDLLFSLGMIELGGEIGVYVMEVDYYYEYYYYYGYSTFFIAEAPLDALVRINLNKNRSFALELRGGGWFIVAGATDYEPYTEFGFNAGARLVVKWFYIGGDYISTPLYGTCWSAEAGVKFSF